MTTEKLATCQDGKMYKRTGDVKGTATFFHDDPRPFTYVLNGFALPPAPPPSLPTSWHVHLEAVKDLQLRQDDVLLCAYPKAGTHWLWEVTSMLLHNKTEYENRSKNELMVEYTDVDKLDKHPSPRLLNTHLPFYLLPWQQMKERRTKILHVYRNPKDSCVSFYHHLKAFADRPVAGMEFSQFCEIFFYENGIFGNYFLHMKQMHTFTEQNPEVPVLSVSFEDMKKNPSDGVQKLAKFLELDVSEKFCQEIAVACTFDNMKKGAELKNAWGESRTSGDKKKFPVQFYRKGEIGDWKNYFTMTMSEKMDGVIKEKMEGLPYPLQFS